MKSKHFSMAGNGSKKQSMSEHGLSAGNTKHLKKAMPEHKDMNSVLEEHKLQHSDYGEMTGNNYSDTD